MGVKVRVSDGGWARIARRVFGGCGKQIMETPAPKNESRRGCVGCCYKRGCPAHQGSTSGFDFGVSRGSLPLD